jgi:hypothetical protein
MGFNSMALRESTLRKRYIEVLRLRATLADLQLKRVENPGKDNPRERQTSSRKSTASRVADAVAETLSAEAANGQFVRTIQPDDRGPDELTEAA